MSKVDLNKEYNFPVYGTQGGGLAKYEGNTLVWVEPPTEDFPDMKVGDPIPEEWGTAAANQRAQNEADRNRWRNLEEDSEEPLLSWY